MSPPIPRNGRSPRRGGAGFTLTELMVSLAIGLFLLSGVVSTVMATRQTNQRKAELDVAVEAFRFGAYAVSRQIRQATGVVAGSTGTSMTLQMPVDAEDCTGEPLTSAQQNVITVSGGALTCKTGTNAAVPLVYGVNAVAFRYGSDTNNDKRVADSATNNEYAAALPATPASVRSVKVTLTLAGEGGANGIAHTFIATLRSKALGI